MPLSEEILEATAQQILQLFTLYSNGILDAQELEETIKELLVNLIEIVM